MLFASSSDWFIMLFVYIVIAHSNKYGFSLTLIIAKFVYCYKVAYHNDSTDDRSLPNNITLKRETTIIFMQRSVDVGVPIYQHP